ncbi:MAG: 2-C-methyl-D-erythritol 4-phosphate cytidylyltransferase [Coriobacteriia bacterium]|nr:2-C-methyl-D-erythritol 4-phosphate cytidylyltransferase [Coriobacteriia bacterium]
MNAAIIVAGGSGERAGFDGGKQLLMIAGLPLLAHTISAFELCAAVDEIVVVAHPDRADEYRRKAVEAIGAGKVSAVVGGGDTRQESVAAGLGAVSGDADNILVHDGARPLITPDVIGLAVEALAADVSLDGVVVGHPAYDTLKVVDAGRKITGTPDRSLLWVAQTPQVFRAEVLRSAYAAAEASGYTGTDDASIVEHFGGVVAMVQGPTDNMKVTVPEDVIAAEQLLRARLEGGGDG